MIFGEYKSSFVQNAIVHTFHCPGINMFIVHNAPPPVTAFVATKFILSL